MKGNPEKIYCNTSAFSGEVCIFIANKIFLFLFKKKIPCTLTILFKFMY